MLPQSSKFSDRNQTIYVVRQIIYEIHVLSIECQTKRMVLPGTESGRGCDYLSQKMLDKM